ncbi:MAG: serine/threonine-protein kinase [Planctomycetota bacterium]
MGSPDAADPGPTPPSEFRFERDELWLEQLRDAMQPEAPRTIGPYQVLGEPRRGGQGLVYRAVHSATRAQVALKRLVAGRFSTPEAIARFQRELEVAAELEHPCIVQVRGMEIVDGQPVLVMEWIDGEPITDWARRPETSRAAALLAVVQVCDAVHCAHRHGVLHRDLKPANILVDRDGQPRVLDFGVAKILGHEQSKSLTRSHEFVGTLAYAAPEQVRGAARSLDARADGYAMGVVLYEILTGRLPYGAVAGIGEAMRAIEHTRVAPPSAHAAVGYELDTIALKALSVDPAMRYQSVDALGEDLRRLQRGEPILAHPPSTWYQARKLMTRNPVASLFAVATCVLALALAAVQLVQSSRLTRAHAREVTARRQAEEVTEFIRALFHDASPMRSGHRADVLGLIERATERVDSMVDAPPLARAVMLESLGTLVGELGHYTESVDILREALRLMIESGGAAPADLADCHVELANALHHTNQPQEARELLQRAIELYSGAEVAGSVVARATLMLARTEHLDAKYDEAERLIAAAAARLAEPEAPSLPPDPLATDTRAMALRCEGKLLLSRGDSAGAFRTLRRSLKIKRDLVGDDHPQLIEYLIPFGSAAMAAGRLDIADTAVAATRRIVEALDGPESVRMGKILVRTGELRRQQSRDAEAAECFRQAQPLLEPERDLGNGWYANCLSGLGQICLETGRYDDAVQHFKDALDLAYVQGGSRLIGANGNLAKALVRRARRAPDKSTRLEDLEQAEHHFLESLRVERELHGDLGPKAHVTLGGLADLATARGDLDRAEQYNRDCAALVERRTPDRNVIVDLCHLSRRTQEVAEARADSAHADYALAIGHARRAVECARQIGLPAADLDHVLSRSVLLRVLWTAGEVEECAQRCRALLEVEHKAWSHSYDRMIDARYHLGMALGKSGDLDGALEAMRVTLEKLATTPRPMPGWDGVLRQRLAQLCTKMGKAEDAKRWQSAVDEQR